MHIRRFMAGEEASLFEIYFSAIHLIACRDYTAEQINAWAPSNVDSTLWQSRMRGINPFVAELDGKPVGYADVQPSGYVDHFFVHGRFPRQGIGKALMNAIHNEAHGSLIKVLTSDVSRTAQPFFIHCGFEVVEQRSPIIRGVEVPNALLRKVL
jgi:putative acetyltransferase